MAAARGAALLLTDHDTYSAARLVSLAHAAGDLMETDVLRFGPETLLSEAAEDLLGSTHREAVVVDDEDRVIGILTRTNVARGIRRRVVLVDHNEASQSAAGIEEAEIVEIVDHHRVGDIETPGPIMFLNLPVGSTATIVATRFEQLGVEVPPAIAGALLAALLTDTVILKSPTTTDTDRRVCGLLASAAGVDPSGFGMEVFRSRSAGEVFSAERVLRGDVKEYRVGDVLASIAQYETVDLTDLMDHADELREAMEERASGPRGRPVRADRHRHREGRLRDLRGGQEAARRARARNRPQQRVGVDAGRAVAQDPGRSAARTRRRAVTDRRVLALWAVSGVLLVAFWELAGEFSSSAAVSAFDLALSNAIQSLRAPWLTTLMLAITALGSWPVVTGATAWLAVIAVAVRPSRGSSVLGRRRRGRRGAVTALEVPVRARAAAACLGARHASGVVQLPVGAHDGVALSGLGARRCAAPWVLAAEQETPGAAGARRALPGAGGCLARLPRRSLAERRTGVVAAWRRLDRGGVRGRAGAIGARFVAEQPAARVGRFSWPAAA